MTAYLRGLFAAGAIIFAANAIGHMAGCAAASGLTKTLDEVNDPSDDAALRRCRMLGRGIKADGGSSASAWDAYAACVADAGLR